MKTQCWLWSASVVVVLSIAGSIPTLQNCEQEPKCNKGESCSITVLKCSNENIGILEPNFYGTLNTFFSLRNLKLTKTGIKSLGDHVFRNMHVLQILNLSDNLLISLNIHALFNNRNLECLDLSNNKLKSLNDNRLFVSQRILQTLILSNNSLTELRGRSLFSSMVKLERVDLSFNNLHFLSNDIFSSQEHLETLQLEGNKLTSLDVNLTKLKSLKRLDLNGNPFVCGCELRLTILRLEERGLVKRVIYRNQSSDPTSHVFNDCNGNEYRNACTTSDVNVTKPDDDDDDLVPATYSQAILAMVALFIFLLLACCGVVVTLYCKRKLRSPGRKGIEVLIQSDVKSNNNYEYDYVTSSNISFVPELPARPRRNASCEERDQRQVNSSLFSEASDYERLVGRNYVSLEEPAFSGTDYCYNEGQQIKEPVTGNTQVGIQERTSSRKEFGDDTKLPEIPLTRKSDCVIRIREKQTQNAVHSGETMAGCGDSEVLVKNSLYSD